MDINYRGYILLIREGRFVRACLKSSQRGEYVNWADFAKEKFEQGIIVIDEKTRLIFGVVGGIDFDKNLGLTTVRLVKAIENGKEGKPKVLKMDKYDFRAEGSFPIQIEGGAIKFNIVPFGDKGVILPKGSLIAQTVLDAAGINGAHLPFGALW